MEKFGFERLNKEKMIHEFAGGALTASEFTAASSDRKSAVR